MSGSPVNLNRARKARSREEAKSRADANAIKHGRTKAEKQADRARAEKAASHVEAHRLRDEE